MYDKHAVCNKPVDEHKFATQQILYKLEPNMAL